jgi:hypothetical protein
VLGSVASIPGISGMGCVAGIVLSFRFQVGDSAMTILFTWWNRSSGLLPSFSRVSYLLVS